MTGQKNQAHRIEVSAGKPDDALRKQLKQSTGAEFESILPLNVYTIEGDLPQEALERLGREVFSDTITESFSLSPAGNKHQWDYAVEIGLRPGMTDDEGNIAAEAVEELLGTKHRIHKSRQYLINGATKDAAEKIGWQLANIHVNRLQIKNRSEWNPEEGMGVFVPSPRYEERGSESIDLTVPDDQLMRMGDKYGLSLNTEEYRTIAARYPRISTLALEMISQHWSEHCKHNIFNAMIDYEEDGTTEGIDSLFKTYISGATEELQRRGIDWIVSVFSDNAGIIKFDDEFNLAFKAETHNTPSYFDPYMGAITGVDGLARDIYGAGMGAKEIFRVDVLCFGDPRYSGPLPKGLMHPARVFAGVRSGVRDGGNKCGTPTVGGSVNFDAYPFRTLKRPLAGMNTIESYAGKPLVYCVAGGIMPAYIQGKPSHVKKANPGDAIILVGGKTGKDGIHGATGSSVEVDEHTAATLVQMDEPIVQKREFDFLLEARDKRLYRDITDNGAGGISCSVGEMAHESGGADVEIVAIPLKHLGMIPDEIMISESQNRMTLSVAPEYVEPLLDMARRYGVDANVIGKFTDSGHFNVKFNGKQLAEIDLNFLKNAPRRKMSAKWERPSYEEPSFSEPDTAEALLQVLRRPNIASKETTLRMYDHEVKAGTVVKPFVGRNNDGPSDAAVVYPLEMQRKGSRKGFSASHGINPKFGLIDTYYMAASNIDEAIRNAIAVGADPERIALLDNFCWSVPNDPYRLAQLVRACKACHDYTLAFGTPLVSGKDSMYNQLQLITEEKTRVAVPPTLLISAIGMVPDISKSITMDLKKPGNLIYAVGHTAEELGGSEYYALMGSERCEAWVGNHVPKVDARRALHAYIGLHEAIQHELVAACHDCSDGGLGVTAAEMAFAGGYGMKIDMSRIPKTTSRNDYTLFSESNSRMLVEVPQRYAKYFEKSMNGSVYSQIGTVTEMPYLEISDGSRSLARMHIADLKKAWQETLNW